MLSTLLAAAALALGFQQKPLENGGVLAVEVSEPPGTRVRYFRLDHGDEATEPLGLVRWVSGPDPENEGGWRVEQDVTFFAEATRVIHTERLHRAKRKLVWREVRARSGRTVLVEWTPDGRAVSLETVGGEVVRKDLELGPDVLLPLALVEHARAGVDWDGTFPVYQPLVGDTELQRLSVERSGPERVLELRRLDGDLAGRFRFRDGELVGFRWQAGDLVARAIPAAAFDDLSTAAQAASATRRAATRRASTRAAAARDVEARAVDPGR